MKTYHTSAKIALVQPNLAPQHTFVFISLLLLLSFVFTTAVAQEEQYSKHNWMFGLAAGANFNFYRGSTQQLNADFTPPTAFHNGEGAGLFLAPSIEYHNPTSRFGFQLQAGYDSRKGKFTEVYTPCDCPADLKTKLSYITVEPSLRFAPYRSNFYLFGGPRLAFVQDKSFTYVLHTNPAFPLQVQGPPVKGDFSAINNTIISMQVGLGYDIALNRETSKTQWVLSPFISYHPYFGQNPRNTETWNVNTLRSGVVLKFGQGHLEKMIVDNVVQFSINPPINVKYVKNIREVFPLRNYIFFDAGSTSIPARYVLLTKNQVADFKEEKVQFSVPQHRSIRSERQMEVYYNILNILGDRMVKYPATKITLVGSAHENSLEGMTMAHNVKDYLVTVFGIEESRISVAGSMKPAIPSEVKYGVKELDLLEQGNRRVTIESASPELLMEFQSGKDVPLKPIEIYTESKIPDGDVVFNIGTKQNLKSWSLQVDDKKGIVQNFGPFYTEQTHISRKAIMGKQAEGNYTVTMTGLGQSGKIITQKSELHLIPYIAPEVQESLRFSVIFEFNESKSIALYEKYLTEVVTPKIPLKATVLITGYTDVVGDANYNKALSLARANDVKSIIEKSLANAGRTDVKLEITGNGEDETLSPFENNYPEERFYNRTVVIDIIK